MADDFAAMFESSPARGKARLEAGKQIEGTVIEISGGLVIVDIGFSADATIDVLEFDGRTINVGDKIKATVANPRQEGPELTMSLGRGGTAVNTASLQLALEGGTPISGTVTASNKGGFDVEIAGVRAFCPISQIDSSYVNEPEIFVGQTFDFQVTEIREGGRSVVVSRRKLLEDERRQAENAMAANLSPGAIVEGTVKKTIRHGAIIDLGGVEGFIPMSELSRARIENAEDVVTIGEKVRAQVLSAERGEKGMSIRLSMKALEAPSQDSPVRDSSAAAQDEILNGKVVKHVPNGLIVATPKGEGLVPTRELSLAPGADHRRSYPVDTELRVVVVSRDGSNGKLRFSVGRVAQVEERQNYRDFAQPAAKKGKGSGMGSLGDLMAEKFGHLAAQASAAPPKASAPVQAAEKPAPAHAPAAVQKAAAGQNPKREMTGVHRRGK